MNRNDKTVNYYKVPASFINDMIKDYFDKVEELKKCDARIRDPHEEDPIMSPLEYAMTCGQMAIYEALLHGCLGVLLDEELYQSELIKAYEGRDDV